MTCYNTIELSPKTYATRANAMKPVDRITKFLPENRRVFNVTILERIEGSDVRYFAVIFNVDKDYFPQMIHLIMTEGLMLIN